LVFDAYINFEKELIDTEIEEIEKEDDFEESIDHLLQITFEKLGVASEDANPAFSEEDNIGL